MTRSAPEPAPPEVSFEHGGLWTTIRFSVHKSLIHGGYFCGGRDDINWRRWNFPLVGWSNVALDGLSEMVLSNTVSIFEPEPNETKHLGNIFKIA